MSEQDTFLPCQYCGKLILANKLRCPLCNKVNPFNRSEQDEWIEKWLFNRLGEGNRFETFNRQFCRDLINDYAKQHYDDKWLLYLEQFLQFTPTPSLEAIIDLIKSGKSLGGKPFIGQIEEQKRLDRPELKTIASLLAQWKDNICRMVENDSKTLAESPLETSRKVLALIEPLVEEAKKQGYDNGFDDGCVFNVSDAKREERERIKDLFDSEPTHCSFIKTQGVEECYVIRVKDW